MLFIIYLSYIFLIWPLLEARAEIQKYFRWFLVQMKSLEFAFEINWPLEAKETRPDILLDGHRNLYQLENVIKSGGTVFCIHISLGLNCLPGSCVQSLLCSRRGVWPTFEIAIWTDFLHFDLKICIAVFELNLSTS